MVRRAFHERNIPCPYPRCLKFCGNRAGLTMHLRIHTQTPRRSVSPVPSTSDPGSPGRRSPSTAGGGDVIIEGGPPEPLAVRRTEWHPDLDGRICDKDGNFLPPGTAPPPPEPRDDDDYSPYRDALEFHLADLLYRKVQMPAGAIDELLQIWAATNLHSDPPFADHHDLYDTIDSTNLGHVPWQSFEVSYSLPVDPTDPTPWKRKPYTVYFRDPRLVLHNQLANPDFKSEIDLAPKRVYAADGTREYEDFMSGNWAWQQANEIAEDPQTHGSVFVPTILGSDKTTVSVATGQNDFYPLYLSNGLVHNNVRRAHRNAVSLIGFLAIPKTDREYDGSEEFRNFRRQLFHGSLAHIMESLRPGMTTPEVVRFGDGHYRRVVYGLGPYITDYPEQVLLTCVVQGWCSRCTASNDDLDGEGGRRTQEHTEALFDLFEHKRLWDEYGIVGAALPFTWHFPRADIHKLISPDILHQIIKGTFKDHLVTWVGQYLVAQHGKKKAAQIMADIDRRIAAVPPFPGLRRFPEGRNFKQWTGDDYKALMKVYLPAIEGHVPPQMLRAFSAFLDFCYLVRRNVIDESTLTVINDALARYHQERVIFQQCGVCPDGFSLPRQHSLTHYHYLITQFGAPNGLCSSITESKHIKAVKEPWRRSSRNNALEQILTINDRLDKLAAARVDFTERGMLSAAAARSLPLEAAAAVHMGAAPNNDDDDDLAASDVRDILGEVKLAKMPFRGYPRAPDALGAHTNIPTLTSLIRRYLYARDNRDADLDISTIPLSTCPDAPRSVNAYPSAAATFYAPSDQSGLHGALRERIRAVRSWRRNAPRYDCVLTEASEAPGFRGLNVARVLLFLSFKHAGTTHECAVVTWFSPISTEPCPDVGMWMVKPDTDDRGRRRIMDIISIRSILRGVHLIPIFGDKFLPRGFKYSDSLDSFKAYYVNKYADHHSHEIIF
ncbi:hypothetical protein FB45DRAFT_783012 [Roridomyces roridus]|uniref:C2H2-type domain-containing protein n=1 Tax=Roridomyces roridus TaxID=1738132 RepID=A0AAD7CH12_9AGAR|nr:hypothetical protein FB45DRAFT_783012 [Roridomyces roridus]